MTGSGEAAGMFAGFMSLNAGGLWIKRPTSVVAFNIVGS